MKKIISLALSLLLLCAILTGCGNHQVIDTTYSFERVIISMPDGTVVDGKVDSWKDFEDGDSIQVKVDGVTYLTHISNVVLISE